MGTYHYEKVISDYEHGRISVEMAMGHGLQHIGKLYEAQAATTADRRTEQAQIDALEKRVNTLQMAVDRLNAFMEKVRRKPKKPNDPSQPKPGQP
jgi:cell division protein FtsB